MKNFTFKDIIDLRNDAYELCNSLADNYGGDVSEANDWCKMCRIYEKLDAIVEKFLLCAEFGCLPSLMESEKDRFEILKVYRKRLREIYKKDFDAIIGISRNWEMYDYRCQNFQRRMEETFLAVQSSFEE